MQRGRRGHLPAVAMGAAAALLMGGTVLVVGSALPPAPATAAEASATPDTPSPSPSALPSGWPGFQLQAEAFTKTAGDTIAKVRDALFSGNAGAVVDDIQAAATAGTDLLVWLDANPPEACFTDAWGALHDATDQLVPMFTGLATNGLDGAMDGLINAGTALVAADDAIASAAAACGPALPSPNGSPQAMLATH
ncbi:MAG: hypothetical protein U0869_15305 [Chloroflexota bacterium]